MSKCVEYLFLGVKTGLSAIIEIVVRHEPDVITGML